MRISIKRLSVLPVAFSLAIGSFASPLSVKAKMDSVVLQMGRVSNIHVEVSGVPDGSSGGFPAFKDCPSDGFLGLYGDSVELRRPVLVDSASEAGGRRRLTYDIPVQSFDSGSYRIPEFIYVAGRDTARSNPLALKVLPVQVTANDTIAPYAPVLGPDGSSVFDHVPDFLYYWWWVLLVVAALVLLFLWARKRYKEDGFIIPPKPQPSPYTQALDRLKVLRARKLWEKGEEKQYFTELTDILRLYLYRRFHINAMEMTSRQIMETVSDNDSVKDKREYIRQILNMADFVKFAKVRPLPDDNVAALDNAVKFVEETRPSAEEEAARVEAEMAEYRRRVAADKRSFISKILHPASAPGTVPAKSGSRRPVSGTGSKKGKKMSAAKRKSGSARKGGQK